MPAQIVAENLSKRYYLSQAWLPRSDFKARALNLGRWLRGLRPIEFEWGKRESIWALKDVSFEVEQGQRLGIIGRNGSGKSTLLKILSRITDPTEGRARLRGRVGSLLEVGTGFHPDLSGRENILLNGAILGMSSLETRRKFEEIVDFAEIEKFLEVPVKHYSSGMYVRLAFAVAAHMESEILLVDEVLAVGDAAFQRKCMGKMQHAGEDGRTVLFVSHATATVTRLCTHGLLLDYGQIKAYGDANDVVREYLGRQLTAPAVWELPPDPKRSMALRKVQLNPDAVQPSNELRYDEDITLRIEYDVNEEVEDATVWFALQTIESQYIFVTADYDLNPSMLGVRRPGYYRADIHLAGKWLNVGEYQVVVGLNKNHPVEQYNREETLTFKILNIGTPSLVGSDHIRPGFLQPYLRWDTKSL
jgi:lipopolysaccharide transport system ATP-binding protein